VAFLNTSLLRFFAASIVIHLLFLLSIWPKHSIKTAREEAIPVSILPIPEGEKPSSTPVPRTPASRTSKVPATIAKKDSRMAREKPMAPGDPPMPAIERSRPEPAPREPMQEQSVVAERQLPSLKELLPSATLLSSNSRTNAPVNLNTKDPNYVTYFNKIKQSIESQWEYPQVALRYGLQGKLALEFTISGNGQLEQVRLLRSSGSQVLDEEALRAIKASAPFPPIPPWVKPSPLSISATMEYHDTRLNYRFNR
jgi:protein TonB